MPDHPLDGPPENRIDARRYFEMQLKAQHDYFTAMLASADLRYQQRFDAQVAAVQAALTAQEKAVAAALAAAEKAVAAALAAAEKAVSKAEAAADVRALGMNEWRATVTDLTSGLMSRPEATALMAGLQANVTELKERLAKREGSGAGMQQGWAYLVGGIGLLLSLLMGGIAIVNSITGHAPTVIKP